MLYEISPDNFGPFNNTVSNEDLKEFMDTVERFSMDFSFKHTLNAKTKTSHNCYKWQLTQNYEYTNHGVVVVTLDTDRTNCESYSSKYIFS